jgi:hypothetical protein
MPDEMSKEEWRQVLEGIARDEDAYPRDRIKAIETLAALGLSEDEPTDDELYPADLQVRRSGRRR